MAEEDAKPDDAIEAEVAEDVVEAAVEETEELDKRKYRRNHQGPSKRYRKAQAQVDKTPKSVPDAIELLKSFESAKFDETVELHVKLGVDSKRPDQQVRGTFVFPHGIGAEKRVIAFAEGDMVAEAEAAGATVVGGADLAKRIQEGWLEFDVVIAHPGMMRHVGKLGRVLGPRKLMPNPKAGTVTADVATAVKEFSAGKSEFRLDDGANIHMSVGKKSFSAEKLSENIEAFLLHMETVKPAGVKGHFIIRATVTATMSPGISIELPN